MPFSFQIHSRFLRILCCSSLFWLSFLLPLSAEEENALPASEVKAATIETNAPTVDEDLTTLQATHGRPFDFFTISNLWILIATAMVFVMHLGFTCVETGLCRAKNTNNIIFKNLFIISMGVLSYAIWGFNAMYPAENWAWKDVFAFGKPIETFTGTNLTFAYGGTALAMTAFTDFIFQAMFAATAATIVSGAVAERIKLSSMMVISLILVGFAYPIVGGWKWGGGWLNDLDFYDFAGSSVVHAFGGFAALAVVLVLGPRIGKYSKDGKIRPLLPHSTPLASIGVFLLFFGWFGFNGGSVLSANPEALSLVFVTTTLAACAGGLASMLTAWIVTKKPDISMSLNGLLAGLVGITAGADSVGVWSACTIGLIAGIIVVFAILLFDRLRIDDPVGAISVHGVCGIWGTLAVGIFSSTHKFGIQLLGTVAISVFAFAFAYLVAILVRRFMGIRVDEEEEIAGLDIAEHGSPAYAFEVSDHSN